MLDMSASKTKMLASLPPIYILPTNLSSNEMHDAEDLVNINGGQLSYEPKEARLFLGQVTKKNRAAFELRRCGLWTEESALPALNQKKRKRESTSTLATSRSLDGVDENTQTQQEVASEHSLDASRFDHHIAVLRIDWLKQTVGSGKIAPFQPYLVYSAHLGDKPTGDDHSKASEETTITYIKASPEVASSQTLTSAPSRNALPIMKYSPRRFRDQKHRWKDQPPRHPGLHRSTTSEHEMLDRTRSQTPSSLPPPPAWQLETHPRPNYACLRSTFADPPNAAFLALLFKIKEARILTLDEIGVRAYSTSIASISAYPHVISSPTEITRLPGCSDRIAALWLEWYNSDPENSETRTLAQVEALNNDEDLKALKLFYGIWGVGADTARKFYFEYGWKELDDAIEFGWTDGSLNRVQQIGLKFYDDFEQKIRRDEVEQIADVILQHARSCRDIPKQFWSNAKNGYRGNWNKSDDGHGDQSWDPRDMICVIVGGYRRGKTQCGDVDVILSHRDEEMTRDLVVDVVASLEKEEYITHTLTLHTTTTDRDQQTLPFRAKGHAGHGFDSLDKALCVWQDPKFDKCTYEKNPNVHRRVDIIVSPWRTIGAAVLGWSGATTFERDIRRWCRKENGWKFDSSGVRDRATGAVLDFETFRRKTEKDDKGKGRARSFDQDFDPVGDCWEDRERRLMEGIGIGWRPARERCTG